jgi:excisionase family DNA binding protein
LIALSDKLLTTREAARYLHVSEASIRRWADGGLLSASRVGRRRARRFREEDLVRAMRSTDSHLTGPSQPVTAIRLQEMTIPVGEHLCVLYGRDDRRGRLEIPFLRDGLREGQTSLLLAPPAMRDQYLEALRREGVEVEAALRAGLLVLLALDRRRPEDLLATFERAFTAAVHARPGPLRFVGDTLAGLGIVESVEGLRAVERGLAELSRRFPLVTLCSYDVRAFDGVALLDALELHLDTFGHPVGYFLS